MIRQAQVAVPATQWVRGVANFMFLSLGHGESGQQYEIKNTINGQSTLVLSNAPSNIAIIQAARIGQRFIFMRHTDSEGWVVHGLYDRGANPLSNTVQVGMTVYTDWQKYGDYLNPNVTYTVGGVTNVDGVWVHNTHYLDATLPAHLTANATPYNPDIIAYVDYFRYTRPSDAAVSYLATNALASIPPATLISFFGNAANRPGTPSFRAATATAGLEAELGGAGSGFVYRVEQYDGSDWNAWPGGDVTASHPRVLLPLPDAASTARWVRARLID